MFLIYSLLWNAATVLCKREDTGHQDQLLDCYAFLLLTHDLLVVSVNLCCNDIPPKINLPPLVALLLDCRYELYPN